ncbi:MAG: hypothetical protein LBL91_03670 [Lachnospiraceae bacterium]|jgi:hypothetical protein|nr:hypothetical protein [Lachnospiraceae bacterium]
MGIKRNKMNNKNTNFNNNGDVFDGDKKETNIYTINLRVTNNKETYEILTEKENYSEFYKNYISKFEELDGYAFSLFYPQLDKKNFIFQGKTLSFGKKIIDWVYGLDKFPEKEIQDFYSNLKAEFGFNNETVIVKRWSANIPYFKSDLRLAYENYNNLFDEMDNDKTIPLWYKDDITIDGRNIMIQYDNTLNRHTINNKFQEKLNQNPHKLAYPDIDRIRSELFRNVSKHVFDNKNKSKYTTIYGVGLEECFAQIQNLIFLTIFYGSITHLRLVRELISDVMYMYADTFEDEEFYTLTMKMLLLSGEFKKYRNLYDKIKLQYNCINSNDFVQALFNSRHSLFEFEHDKATVFLYDIYGRDIDDALYNNIEDKMLNIIQINDNYQISLITNTYRAIANNIIRFNNIKRLLDIMKQYCEQSYSIFYIEFSKVLLQINVEELSEEDFECFQIIIDYLIENKQHIDYGLSHCIINIKKRNPKTKKYDSLIEKEGSNENIIYQIEMEKNQLVAIKEIVNIYKSRHQECEKHPGVYSDYSTNYTIGTKIFSTKFYKNELKDFILNDYLSLAKSIILSPNENIYEKIRHIKLLAHLLIVDKDVSDEVIATIHKSKNIKHSDIFGFGEINSRDEIDLDINIMMCDVLASTIKPNELFTDYLEIATNNENNIQEILDCIHILNDYSKIKNKNVIDKLFLLFNICYRINDIDRRNDAVIMSKLFMGTEYQEKVLNKLKKRAKNIISGEVKGYINLIRNTPKRNKIYYQDIINILNNSTNFYIRYMCNKYL